MQNLRRLTVAILCALLVILQDARGDVVRIATWNLEWFPGGKPNSSQAERLVHMSAAKDALIDIRPDILYLQEVRDCLLRRSQEAFPLLQSATARPCS